VRFRYKKIGQICVGVHGFWASLLVPRSLGPLETGPLIKKKGFTRILRQPGLGDDSRRPPERKNRENTPATPIATIAQSEHLPSPHDSWESKKLRVAFRTNFLDEGGTVEGGVEKLYRTDCLEHRGETGPNGQSSN